MGQIGALRQKFQRSGVEIAKMFGQNTQHLGSYDSNSPNSDIDEAGRCQLVFCFFHSWWGKSGE